MRLRGAEIFIKALKDQGVDTIFGYPGAAVLPIYDELLKDDELEHILVRQESGAVHAAEGYARSTGKAGVLLVTSGPGATNIVTGVTDAMMDSVPIICFTGQVPSTSIGNDAFQEADMVGITRPSTKHSWLVKDVNNLARVIHEAFYIATTGRPGPILIDIPKDVLTATAEYTPPTNIKHKTYNPQIMPEQDKIKQAIEMIKEAESPILYCGGGVLNSYSFKGGMKDSETDSFELLKKFVKKTDMPVTLTLPALGCFDGEDEHFLGMPGMHGTYEANMAMHGCDLMICLGARFDDRVTSSLKGFSPNSKKIHIDIDKSSINKNVMVDLGIIGDAGEFLKAILKEGVKTKDYSNWWNRIKTWRSMNCLKYEKSDKIIKPQEAIETLYELTKDSDTYIATEVGQHQMWTAQYYKFRKPMRFMTSCGLGTMGYGLPSAIGTLLADRDRNVVLIAGDSSFQMNIQELGTILQEQIPLKMMVLNNHFMGMVKQHQDLFYDRKYSGTVMEAQPDLAKIADAYGIKSFDVSDPAKLEETMKEWLEYDGAALFNVIVDKEEHVYPMIPAGQSHNTMLIGGKR
jgi:acetolactate synthase-1/2/3 large subunit